MQILSISSITLETATQNGSVAAAMGGVQDAPSLEILHPFPDSYSSVLQIEPHSDEDCNTRNIHFRRPTRREISAAKLFSRLMIGSNERSYT
jgi:hypothetical protein